MKNVTRRKKTGRKGSFLPLLLVVVLFAGGLGYGVTKWVILPSLPPQSDMEPEIMETTPPPLQGTSPYTEEAQQVTQGSLNEEDGTVLLTQEIQGQDAGAAQSAYAIQFGSYSTYERAQEAALNEAAKGRTVRIVEKDGSYKIVGSPFSDRTEAERALAAISPEGEDGLFITTMEVLTQ